MKNLSCLSCPSSNAKPNRLIWQDLPGENPQALQAQTAGAEQETNEAKRAEMENELFNKVVRPQVSGEEGMSPEQFMEKHKNFLTTDFEAYKTGQSYFNQSHFNSMGVEKNLKFVEVGYGYLESSNPEIVSEYIAITLSEFKGEYNQLTGDHEYQHPLYKDIPERREKVKKDLLSFMNYFIKEKAAKVWENNPVALAQTLAFLSEMKSTIPDAYQFLTTKVKSFELSDIQMRDVVNAVVYGRIGKDRSEALPYVSRILYESKDKPLSNIVIFKETMDVAVWGDPKLFLFVLNRGKDIVRDPIAREYIENLLAGTETEKVKNKKVWKNFLKELRSMKLMPEGLDNKSSRGEFPVGIGTAGMALKLLALSVLANTPESNLDNLLKQYTNPDKKILETLDGLPRGDDDVYIFLFERDSTSPGMDDLIAEAGKLRGNKIGLHWHVEVVYYRDGKWMAMGCRPTGCTMDKPLTELQQEFPGYTVNIQHVKLRKLSTGEIPQRDAAVDWFKALDGKSYSLAGSEKRNCTDAAFGLAKAAGLADEKIIRSVSREELRRSANIEAFLTKWHLTKVEDILTDERDTIILPDEFAKIGKYVRSVKFGNMQF